jgi:hypothetical protein
VQGTADADGVSFSATAITPAGAFGGRANRNGNGDAAAGGQPVSAGGVNG